MARELGEFRQNVETSPRQEYKHKNSSLIEWMGTIVVLHTTREASKAHVLSEECCAMQCTSAVFLPSQASPCLCVVKVLTGQQLQVRLITDEPYCS